MCTVHRPTAPRALSSAVSEYLDDPAYLRLSRQPPSPAPSEGMTPGPGSGGRKATHLVQQAPVAHRCVQILGRFSLEKQAWSNAHVAGHEVPEHRTYPTRTQPSGKG